MLTKTEDNNYARSSSGALINMNVDELARYREEVRKSKRLLQMEARLAWLEQRVVELEKNQNGQNS